MANTVKKTTKATGKTQGRPAHSGFEAPVIGELHPKGTTIKHNPDGTITLVPPKKTAKK